MNEGVFIHEQGLCESSAVGRGTRVWAFAHVLPGATIGEDCNICDGVFIENDVKIGSRVTIKTGVSVWDGVEIEDDVFIGPDVAFANDRFPRSREWLARPMVTRVCKGASIGANATILPGLTIGPSAMIGAGAVVTQPVPANAVVVGNPARITGYVNTRSLRGPSETVGSAFDSEQLPGGCQWLKFTHASDLRGDLVALELGNDIPFGVARFFTVYGVPSGDVRGEHAHRVCHQVLVALAGELAVVLDDGVRRVEVKLDSPAVGLHIPPMTWGTQYKYSPRSVLGVFASHPYDADEYIRDYAEFSALATGGW